MKKLLFAVAIFFVGYSYFQGQYSPGDNDAQPSVAEQIVSNSDLLIADAFSNHESSLQVSGQGVVIKFLSDDNVGSRHQKFIIKLASGQKLLVAHNIDLAPRVFSIREGHSIQFYGEYEWN
jgi:hypothetical protein